MWVQRIKSKKLNLNTREKVYKKVPSTIPFDYLCVHIMMHYKTYFRSLKALLLTLLFVVTISCSDDDLGTPVEESGSGAIQGVVVLHDQFGIPVANEDMTISITGETYTATTAANGSYVLTSVPLGTYELVYEKEGFGTFKTEVEHSRSFERGSTTLLTYYLGEKSTTFIGGNGSAAFDNGNLVIDASTLPAGSATNPVYLSTFFSKEDNVSNQVNIGLIGPVRYISGSTNVEVEITAAELANLGFTSGETIYFRIYGDSFQTNAYQGEDGKIHPNANTTSNASVSSSIVMP